ncbi:GH39 family glycosyl hydrolase [Demequina activiva]|uniref:Beta-xylosidase n=1 Tax=Demequina activiva TaxID=1582364 RepID=A0A919PZX4_9MICO|nr:beta-xylosidase [Demequina activiva]GIG53527.1 beta-xylosidase [Demequina activiva]
MPASQPSPVIDAASAAATPLRHVWNECVGAGRANEGLRADWQRQLAQAVDRIGFRYLRFHGLFHDDMFVHRSSYGSGFGPDTVLDQPVHTFSYVDSLFDAILDLGVKPFVELGFMPSGLATQHRTVFWWGAHCSPPNDMDGWVALVDATVRHWVERYGIDEVRTWRFEVWNEPNLVPHFWTGTRTEYFELYEHTVRAIKAVDPGLLVGGPSTSVFVPDDRYAGEVEDRSVEAATADAPDPDALDWRPVWIQELLDFCAQRELPVDFVSTHLYPTDFAFAANDELVHITRHADATRDDLRRLHAILDASPYAGAEVHITEWSSSPSSRDRIHDTVFGAAYITRAYLRCADLADSISYWTFTDIFEEGGAGMGPFHGGFGIVTERGIHKPTFHAFEMLARLGDELLQAMDHGVITRSSATGEVAAVLVNYPADMNGASVRACDSYAEAAAYESRGPAIQVSHRIAGLEPGSAYEVVRVDLDHGNVARAWHRMGEPLNLTREQERELHAVADDLARDTLTVDEDGVLDMSLTLPPWAVASIAPARAD